MTAQRNSSAGETRQQPTGRRPRIWSGPVALLLVVAALWWQWAETQKHSQVGKAARKVNSLTAAAVSGVWQGRGHLQLGTTYMERFLFQVEGDKLFGTASFLAFKRGIEDGRIDGDKISFDVRFYETAEGMSTGRTNRYVGSVSRNQIHFRMQDDKGSPAGGVRR
jgi:hypothetical protein